MTPVKQYRWPEGEEPRRITIRVPASLLQALESAARAQGLSLNAYLIAALEKAAESAPTVTETVPLTERLP